MTSDTDNKAAGKRAGVAIVVRTQEELEPILAAGYRLAEARSERLHILAPGAKGAAPPWLEIPGDYDPGIVETEILDDSSVATSINEWVRANDPALVAFYFDPEQTTDRYALSKELDAAVMRIRCPVALFHATSSWREKRDLDRPPVNVVPFTGDANSRFALHTGLELNPDTQIVVVGTGPAPADDEDRTAREVEFTQLVGADAENPRVQVKLLLGDDSEAQMIDFVKREADAILVGASSGNTLTRMLLGDSASINLSDNNWRIIDDADVSYAIFREYQGWLRSRLALLFSQGESLLPDVSRAERVEIYKEIRRAARPRIDFFVMIGLSAAIASFGLLLNSPAVIIGAMLIAPLMSAIIGMGLGIVQGDTRFLLNATGASLRGGIVAVLMGAFIGALNFTSEPTAEMLARSGPSLLDLAVAVLSGAAAAYALCRKDMSASLPGVAIAVALVPPLATIGLFIAMAEWGEAYGALLLFATNLAAIAMASAMLFALVGFRPSRLANAGDRRLKAFRRGFLIVGLTLLLVVTQLSIMSINKVITRNLEAKLENTIEEHLHSDLTRQAEVFNLRYEEDDSGIMNILVIAASTRQPTQDEIADMSDAAAKLLSKPVRIYLISAPLVTEISSVERNK